MLAGLAIMMGMLLTERHPRSLPIPNPEPQVILINQPKRIPLSRITYYNAVPEQTDDDPEMSACGPTMDGQIAVSRDLFKVVLPCGTRVQLIVNDVYEGEFIVWDTMARRWTETADVLMPLGSIPSWGGLASGYLIVLD
jgi:3D (Asp-Asp-Asp) domain-containing protein